MVDPRVTIHSALELLDRPAAAGSEGLAAVHVDRAWLLDAAAPPEVRPRLVGERALVCGLPLAHGRPLVLVGLQQLVREPVIHVAAGLALARGADEPLHRDALGAARREREGHHPLACLRVAHLHHRQHVGQRPLEDRVRVVAALANLAERVPHDLARGLLLAVHHQHVDEALVNRLPIHEELLWDGRAAVEGLVDLVKEVGLGWRGGGGIAQRWGLRRWSGELPSRGEPPLRRAGRQPA
eukprot:scaffold19746_cov67-Phaeocystis_antarctica.AAC.9